MHPLLSIAYTFANGPKLELNDSQDCKYGGPR